MENKLDKLINILIELRNASMNTNKHTAKDLMKRYNLLFLGSNFNKIYSVELPQSFKTFFDFDININELHDLIPSACSNLHMGIEPLVKLSDANNPDAEIACYCITLW